MKKIFFLLALSALLNAGCKDSKQAVNQGPGAGTAVVETEPAAAAAETGGVRREDFPFDQLFSILSSFGSNIMTDKFAAQSVKDGIREELRSMYDGYREFNGNACNNLSYNLFGGDCYDGFQLGCWRYDADGHILVLLAENGGCDAHATKYIRAYNYDPAAKNAHEVEFPLDPVPTADDFNDIIRLAGCDDIPALRRTMRDRVFNYSFDPEGLRVYLNTLDNWDVAESSALELYYRWNGSGFVRDESVPSPCIHGDGFALIKLGEPLPDLYLQPDPVGYGINYSQGGDLWLVNRGEQDVLQIQMDGGKVYSIEVFDPRYSITEAFYWDGRGKICVGSRFDDYFPFDDDHHESVWLYSDGTVSVDVENYNALLSFRTTSADLEGKLPEVSVYDVKVKLENPRFKPQATVKSILVQHLPEQG